MEVPKSKLVVKIWEVRGDVFTIARLTTWSPLTSWCLAGSGEMNLELLYAVEFWLFNVSTPLPHSPLGKSKILTLSLEKAFDAACLNTLAMVIRQSHFSRLRNAMCSYEILFKVMAIKELLSVDGLLAVAAATSLASSPRIPRLPLRRKWTVSSLSKMSVATVQIKTNSKRYKSKA